MYFFYVPDSCSRKNVEICIPTTKSDQDIEKMVKRTMNKFDAENIDLKFNGLICLNWFLF